MQVAVSTKTNRFGAAARQSQVSPPRAHYDRGWESHPVVLNWERGHGVCWSERSKVVGEGMGRGNGESITANAMIMTMRPTNVTETNQYPAFVAYRRSTHVPTCLEARVHTHRSARTHFHVRMDQR